MVIVRRAASGPIAVQAYSAIRCRIIDLTFKPGELLPETRLAAEFGLSRTPVREALKRLENDGLVEIIPQHGTFVSPIRREFVMSAQFARAALECAIVRQAAEQRPDDVPPILEMNIRQQEDANARGDFDEFYRIDERLHQMLTDAAGRSSVWSLIAAVKIHMDRARKLTMSPDYAPLLIRQHRRIVEAVIDQKPDEAAKAMDDHLQFVVERFDDIVAANPSYVQEIRRTNF